MASEIVKLGGDIREKMRAGEKIYNFTVGDFDPAIFPIPKALEDEIITAYRNHFTNYPAAEGNLDLRQSRVIARSLRSAARIFRDAARLRRIGLVLLRIPIRRPFPDIADHVVQAVAVRRERRDRRSALEAVLAKILARKFTLPGIGHMLAVGRELVAPAILGAVEAAACGEFPFGFGGQLLAGPFGVSQRVR